VTISSGSVQANASRQTLWYRMTGSDFPMTSDDHRSSGSRSADAVDTGAAL
jgi:hypothetical protein